MLQNHGVNVFKHYSDTFLETIAEFYDFSAFSLFLSFDHIFGCITMTIFLTLVDKVVVDI